MIIGITGGSGTGKSTIAYSFGCEVIEADKVYHELLATNKNLQDELINEFGTCERKELREIVFSNPLELDKLDSITFKYTFAAIESKISPSSDVVIEAIKLFESGLDKLCDTTIAVLARRDIRMNRIMERDGLTAEQAAARINAQKSDEFYKKRADRVICTDNGLEIDLKLSKYGLEWT